MSSFIPWCGGCVLKKDGLASAHLDVMMELDLLERMLAAESAAKEDEKSVKDATRKAGEQSKARRRRIEEVRLEEHQHHKEKEGMVYLEALFEHLCRLCHGL